MKRRPSSVPDRSGVGDVHQMPVVEELVGLPVVVVVGIVEVELVSVVPVPDGGRTALVVAVSVVVVAGFAGAVTCRAQDASQTPLDPSTASFAGIAARSERIRVTASGLATPA